MKQLPVTYTIVLVIVALTSDTLSALGLIVRLADLPGVLLSFFISGEKICTYNADILMLQPGNYKPHTWLLIVYSHAVKESQKLA